MKRQALFLAFLFGLTFQGRAQETITYSWIWQEPQNVYSMVVKDGVIYAGTSNYVWISPDTGKTWRQSGPNQGLIADFGLVYPLAKTQNGDLLASSFNGLFRSNDNGQSWVRVQDSATDGVFVAHDGTIYTEWGLAVRRSRDNGKTWQTVLPRDSLYSLGSEPSQINSFVETPSGTILAGSWNSTPRTAAGIFRSTDGGDTWARSNSGLTDTNVEALAAYPIDSSNQTVYATTESDGAFVSYDDGLHWQWIGIRLIRGGGAIVAGEPIGVILGFHGGVGYPLIYRFKNGKWGPLPNFDSQDGSSFAQFSTNQLLIGTQDGIWLAKFDVITTPVIEGQSLPSTYSLSQNYPNPFNPTTTIKFGVPKASPVTLEIYNILGEKVRTLINGENFEPGYWAVDWDGKDNTGLSIPSGVYFYRLVAGEFVKTMKMISLK